MLLIKLILELHKLITNFIESTIFLNGRLPRGPKAASASLTLQQPELMVRLFGRAVHVHTVFTANRSNLFAVLSLAP